MDLIQEVLESTQYFEAPPRYYYWSTLAGISAVLKDKVWFNMGDNYNVYPNIYVLLYGPSGVRKGPAINLVKNLVSGVGNTRTIDGRSSIEAVIKHLGTMSTQPGKPPNKDSCGFMAASELSSSIIGNTAAMDIMTDLFDRIYNEAEWNYRLKVGESVKLTKPTITWLAGTNQALFKEFVPEKNIKGGLIGRMFVISENKKHRSNSLMFKTRAPDKNKLIGRMKEFTKLEGEFHMDQEIRAAVDEWYMKFDTEVAPGLGDETGFVSRILDYVIKIAMILSTGRRGDKIIALEDILEAQKVILPLIVPAKRVVNSVQKTDNSLVTKRGLILTVLSNAPGFRIEKAQLLRSLHLQIDNEDLDKISQYMISMNVLRIDSQGANTYYCLKTERPEVAKWIEEYRS